MEASTTSTIAVPGTAIRFINLRAEDGTLRAVVRCSAMLNADIAERLQWPELHADAGLESANLNGTLRIASVAFEPNGMSSHNFEAPAVELNSFSFHTISDKDGGPPTAEIRFRLVIEAEAVIQVCHYFAICGQVDARMLITPAAEQASLFPSDTADGEDDGEDDGGVEDADPQPVQSRRSRRRRGENAGGE